MKNIHILATDKPSRLAILHNDNLHIGTNFKKDLNVNPQNIYITSDEEIKEGDWILMFDDLGNLFLCDKPQQYLGIEKGHHLNRGLRKIILTTDTQLIKHGVQSIDDEFLKWFVKNPSCEFVEVVKEKQHIGEEVDESYPKGFFDYKIIIPKEETLEEAGLKHCDTLDKFPALVNPLFSFKEGAKWQQERMYSEGDMRLAFETGRNFQLTGENNFNELIEQFKKK